MISDFDSSGAAIGANTITSLFCTDDRNITFKGYAIE